MNSPRHVFGVPLHPLLVHFPITLWIAATVLDMTALVAGPEPWWMLAQWATAIGVAIGAVAIATGFLEYLEPSVAGIDLRLAARHGVRTTVAWCTFTAKMLLAWALSPPSQGTLLVCISLDLVGCFFLMQGVYFGTRQVYEQLEKQ